jgi:hypothetical protein
VSLDKLPDVPVTVTNVVPVAAEELAEKVSVLLLVAGLGLNAAVTPLGKVEVERETLPLNPPVSLMVMVLVAWPPSETITLFGEAESENDGPPLELTVRLTVVVLVKLPDVPVIVIVTVPVVAEPLAVKVSKLVLVVGLGLKYAVTPLGSVEIERVTLPLNPPAGTTVMVVLPGEPPCTTVTLPGDAESVNWPVCCELPPTPPQPQRPTAKPIAHNHKRPTLNCIMCHLQAPTMHFP